MTQERHGLHVGKVTHHELKQTLNAWQLWGIAVGLVGIAAIYSDELIQFGGQTLTANVVTMSVFGAIVMYIISMAALFKLRRTEPGMPRPFMAPMYPWFPAFALLAALVCLATMIYYNPLIAALFFGLMAAGYVVFHLTRHRREIAPLDDMLESHEEMEEEFQAAAATRAH